MALPVLSATFASAADLPRRQMLAQWLVNLQYSGSVADYLTLPEHYLWAKIAVAAGAPRPEADYISLPKNYIWSDLYKAVSGSSGQTIDRGEKEALGWIAAAVRGDTGDPARVATYINWPWRYQVASIITALAVDADAQSFITASGATDIERIDQFVKGVKNLNLWNSMVCWPLRSAQNAGFGSTVHSLGGLGTFNGNLVGGPTWEPDGVKRTTTGDRYINIPSLSVTASGQFTALACASLSAVANARQIQLLTVQYNTEPNTATGRLAIYTETAGGRNLVVSALNTAAQEINRQQTGTTTQIPNDTFHFYGGSMGLQPAMDRTLTRNGSAVGSNGGSMAATWDAVGSNSAILRGQFADNTYTATAAFVAFLSAAISVSQQNAVYTLYKSTLGAGLGLP